MGIVDRLGREDAVRRPYLWKAYAVLLAINLALGVTDVLDGHTLGAVIALAGVCIWAFLAIGFYLGSRTPPQQRPVQDGDDQPY